MKKWMQQRQVQQFAILSLSTLFCFVLLFGRHEQTGFDWSSITNFQELKAKRGIPAFFFLVWNLFLAWVPYWVALLVAPVYKKTNSIFLALGLLSAWLLFFPNAPYIITDFLHLRSRNPVPHWYDLMLIFSFAWTGLMLGLLSLYEIQLFIRQKIGIFWSWSVVFISIGLAGFGIFIGRFQRWNSWDIFTQPKALSYELVQTMTEPQAHSHTLGIAVVISAFMLVSYLFLLSMKGGTDH